MIGSRIGDRNGEVGRAFNKHMHEEFFASYLYMAIASYFEALGLKGFASWSMVQAKGEWSHGMEFYKFLHTRRWPVAFMAIDAPQASWPSPLAAIEAVLSHEIKITEAVNRLVVLAGEVRDYPSSSFLKRFVDEQVEEEAKVDCLLQRMSFIGEGMSQGLLFLDHELSKS